MTQARSSAKGTVDNAPVAELLAAADVKDFAASGALTGSAQLTGTVGNPLVKGDLSIVKGSFQDEPFDRFSGAVSYANNVLELNRGPHCCRAEASRDCGILQPSGRRARHRNLRFQVNSNAMPLAEIATLERARPGASGTVQVSANGELQIGRPCASRRCTQISGA